MGRAFVDCETVLRNLTRTQLEFQKGREAEQKFLKK